jgi:hypothetical protein
MLIIPLIGVVNTPTFSPFCLHTSNLAPASGLPAASVFSIVKLPSLGLKNVTIVGD